MFVHFISIQRQDFVPRSKINVPLCLMTALVFTPTIIGCNYFNKHEIAAAKIQQVVDNPSMPNAQAIQLLAEGYFETDSVVIGPTDQSVQIVTRPADLSRMVDIGQDLDDAKKRSKRAIVFFSLQNLYKLTQAVHGREIGNIDLMLETAVANGEQTDWVPTYRFILLPKKFQEFETNFKIIETAFLKADGSFDQVFDIKLKKLETIWEVKLDEFEQMNYHRAK